MYARLVHVKLNNDGWKSEGQHCPSEKMQAALFDSFYKECQISASSIDYLEFHGAGTKVKEVLEISVILKASRIVFKMGTGWHRTIHLFKTDVTAIKDEASLHSLT